ncbi:putative alpha/beta hydrolase family esterase [Herbaspirillum sp. 1173]|uniref:RBBP9/YdeN family alpha/beta hydrolase n=1 Tax=Herbaspirillum sp. 1173 TaxID=2817734 RepID=UPI00285EE7AA|nr:alpha/beta hydrolase [Herbaspirillum sp. 1173]MDR6739948.1 putative alpha/beta hydrolase family esterase [Herbaspirillum sp. 1173]
MHHSVLVVPGIGNSGPSHWQSLWQSSHPNWRRLIVGNWDKVECDDWVSALERQLVNAPANTLLVAHSLGCLAVAHWAEQSGKKIGGALLVAVPDPAAPSFPRGSAHGFSPLPLVPLRFPSVVVCSADDPYGSVEHGRECANAWGSEFVEVGAKGHLNAESNLGAWPEGLNLLARLSTSIDCGRGTLK